MLLILTSAGDATADYVVDILEAEGKEYHRLNTETLTRDSFPRFVAHSARLRTTHGEICSQDVSGVWYRRPEALMDVRYPDSPEGRFALGEWAEALEGFLAHIPPCLWMNHPSRNASASSKLWQLTIARQCGLKVPETVLTDEEGTLRSFFSECQQRVVVKPLLEGRVRRKGEPDALIYTNMVSDLEPLLPSVACCPTLFQRYIDKVAEYRVTVVDERLHVAKLLPRDSAPRDRHDIRRNNMSDVLVEIADLPPEIASKLFEFMRHFRLRFGAIDLVEGSDGEWYFLEVNANGQWAWLDICHGFTIAQSLIAAWYSPLH